MEIPIEVELKSICQEIESKNLNLAQWSEVESDDMFQLGNFNGGFDADEQVFCFSYFAVSKAEYWFQISLETVKKISLGNIPILIGRPPD